MPQIVIHSTVSKTKMIMHRSIKSAITFFGVILDFEFMCFVGDAGHTGQSRSKIKALVSQ